MLRVGSIVVPCRCLLRFRRHVLFIVLLYCVCCFRSDSVLLDYVASLGNVHAKHRHSWHDDTELLLISTMTFYLNEYQEN